ncbi:DUF6912 family protein [Micropruina sp.]|uniref:DUF6912 family protein n=1 Tax=Micropruina sp. TaxID=2737536 RepID=UPI0039E50BE0
MLVFVPLTASRLTGWAVGGPIVPRQAFAVTSSLRQAFGFTADDEEDAEHTVLHIAGLAGLLYGRKRLVAVVEASARPVPGSEFGEVTVGELPWTAVTALFSDDAADAAAVLRKRLSGRSLATAWDEQEVADFLTEHELLWHGPGEWSTLVGPLDGDDAGAPVALDHERASDSATGFESTWVTASLDVRSTADGGLKRTWFETPAQSFLFLIGDVELGAYIYTDDQVPLNPGDSGRAVALQFWAPAARELATPGRPFTLIYGDREIGRGTIGGPTEPARI